MSSLRDAYLAYQSEIGTEDVILPHPWIKKAPVVVKSQNTTASSTRISSREIPQGPEFFQSIAQVLAQSKTEPQTFTSAPAKAEEPPRIITQAPIPDFKSLEMYWKFLDEEYPKWFPSASLSERSAPVPLARAEGSSHPALALVELAPSLSTNPKVFDGEAGALLDKMMSAIKLDRSQLYLTSVMKTHAPGKSWPRKDIARMLPYFFRELALAGCTTVLLFGEACTQSVLRTGKGLNDLRQHPSEAEGFVFTASHHPSDLASIRDAEMETKLKRESWNDLKWLMPRLNMGNR